jgi:mono/diheme cytochrome c family protein
VQRVILVFAPPDTTGLPSQRVELQAADEPWLWGTSGAYTPLVGDWALEVIVRRVGVPDESTAFALPVREPLPPQRVPPPDIGVGVPLTLQAAWSILPAGTLAWAIPVGLLAVAGALGLALRGRAGPRRSALAVAMAAAVTVGVGSGLLVGSRAVVQAANRATAAQAAAANPVPADADSIERGTSLYLANCSVCHGVTGTGDGPAAEAWARPAPLSAVVPDLTDGELAYRISTGTVGTRMPAYATTLSENDRWDLVNYLRATWDAP